MRYAQYAHNNCIVAFGLLFTSAVRALLMVYLGLSMKEKSGARRWYIVDDTYGNTPSEAADSSTVAAKALQHAHVLGINLYLRETFDFATVVYAYACCCTAIFLRAFETLRRGVTDTF
jgi:hypothetical protein